MHFRLSVVQLNSDLGGSCYQSSFVKIEFSEQIPTTAIDLEGGAGVNTLKKNKILSREPWCNVMLLLDDQLHQRQP